jgi:hypothetical protein
MLTKTRATIRAKPSIPVDPIILAFGSPDVNDISLIKTPQGRVGPGGQLRGNTRCGGTPCGRNLEDLSKDYKQLNTKEAQQEMGLQQPRKAASRTHNVWTPLTAIFLNALQ